MVRAKAPRDPWLQFESPAARPAVPPRVAVARALARHVEQLDEPRGRAKDDVVGLGGWGGGVSGVTSDTSPFQKVHVSSFSSIFPFLEVVNITFWPVKGECSVVGVMFCWGLEGKEGGVEGKEGVVLLVENRLKVDT